MSSWTIPAVLATWISRLRNLVDARLRDLFGLVFCGLLFTRERRRTCTSWFRAADVGRDFQRAYRTVCLAGRRAGSLAMSVLFDIAKSPAGAGSDRIKLAIDDTPTARYGPEVEAAGVHHNPTPGPAPHAYVYGHVWVTLACALLREVRYSFLSLADRYGNDELHLSGTALNDRLSCFGRA
jgi:hypothetical protein